VAGEVVRAPAWMHDSGLEWLHRLRCEPRRLFHRYVVDGLPFAAQLGLHALLKRGIKVLERA
jgi:N-acetylglucosaminyldiphosphoundecaprenol N-acetyl-beta-D-mannosaminyltransferase